MVTKRKKSTESDVTAHCTSSSLTLDPAGFTPPPVGQELDQTFPHLALCKIAEGGTDRPLHMFLPMQLPL